MRRWTIAWRSAVPAVLAGLALAACTNDGQATTTTTTTTASAGSTSTTTTTTAGTTTTSPALRYNARSEVSTPQPCRQDAAGAWVLRGTVTNRAAVRHRFTIVVDFTDTSATVEQTNVVQIPYVAPGKTVDWSTSGARGLAGIECVIRNARFS